MKRVLIAVLVGLAFGVAARAAEEAKQIKGQVQQFNAKQHVLKVKVKDKEQTFRLKEDTPFVDEDGKQLSEEALIEQLAPGAQVTIVMKKQGAKQGQGPQQVSQVQVIRTKTKPKQKTKPDQSSPKQKEKGKPDQSPAQKGKVKQKEKPNQSPAQQGKPKQKKDDQ